MSAVDVLSVMDSAIERERNEGRAYVAQVAARAAVAELIEAATDAGDDYSEAVRYDCEDDEIGSRVCCGVLSYKPHADGCNAARLRAALAAMGGKV